VTLARGILLAGLAASAVACVPRGDPPAGRQLVADRTSRLGGFVRSNGDGITRVLITRPAASGKEFSLDLIVVSVDAAGGPPVERLLATDIAGTFDQACGRPECVDARGRVFIITGFDPVLGFPLLVRIDPVTGDRRELGAAPYIIFSPSAARFLVTDTRDGATTLYEADDRAVPLGDESSATFFGEDVYYLTAQRDLMRLAPGGAPERLATEIGSFIPPQLPGGTLMVLSRPTADRTVSTYAILDTVTLEETPSPLGTTPFTLSPDGRWLFTLESDTGHVTFTERTTGSQDFAQLSPYSLGSYEWRPGHDELWIATGDYEHPMIAIKTPGGPMLEVPGQAGGPTNESGYGSMFTSDGAYWFSMRHAANNKWIATVGSADDPTGPRYDIAPAGTFVWQYWRLADGRILAPASPMNPSRNDLYAIDPATGKSTALGEAGAVVAVGQTRLLAKLHVNDARGDLTAIELATAQATILAREFALEAFVERQGADRVAPGAQVAFRFEARFESPFDGIWLATVP